VVAGAATAFRWEGWPDPNCVEGFADRVVVPAGERDVKAFDRCGLVALLFEPGFGLDRPIGTVGQHLVARVGSVQDLIELLAVVDGGIGLSVAADQLVLAVDLMWFL
jgi:hypothetical protein